MPKLSFLRYEQKFLLDKEQYAALGRALFGKTVDDPHCVGGGYTVHDRYYDTPESELAIEALLRPPYREKLRIRCYSDSEPQPGDTVFLEQKMKVNGFGHKRRIPKTLAQAEQFIAGGGEGGGTQEEREIAYMLSRYSLAPAAEISYYRRAFSVKDEPDIRITVDTSLRGARPDGTGSELLCDRYLLEIKVPAAFPLWLARTLTDIGAFGVSFSKYGQYYRLSSAQKTAVKG